VSRSWKPNNVVTYIIQHYNSQGQCIGTQTELAKRLGVSKQVVNGWKSRNTLPKWYVLEIAQMTDIPVKQLLEWVQ
jgi:DNA-binding XRE family transcriptional regulator